MRLRVPAASVAVALCLAGCSKPATVTTSIDASGGVHTVTQKPQPTPTKKIDFIRATGFGSLEWQNPVDNQKVTLSAGTASGPDNVTYALGPQPIAYADADGDGLEDALVPIVVTYQAGPVTYLYLWRWDAAQSKAVQVADPVAHYSACGNSLTSFGPGHPMGFEISESIRDMYDYKSCGTDPGHPFTRTIGVSDNALVMTKPVLAYGGICYQTYRDATTLPVSAPIHTQPSLNAPLAENTTKIYPTVPDHDDGRAWPDGWRQVGWLTDDMKSKNIFYGVCGFRHDG